MTLTKKNVLSLPYKVQYIELSDIQSWNRYNFNFANIILKAGKVWHDFYTTPGSIEFTEKSSKTSDGVFYATELKQFYPDTNPASDLKVKKLEHKKLIIKVSFSPGDNRIIGNLESAARIKSDIDLSSKKSGITIITSLRSINGSQFYDPDYIS